MRLLAPLIGYRWAAKPSGGFNLYFVKLMRRGAFVGSFRALSFAGKATASSTVRNSRFIGGSVGARWD
jgi:hypothetical protein